MNDQIAPMPDPFVLDIDQLHAMAAESVVRDGLDDFKAHRVMDLVLEVDGGALRAIVEDADSGEPFSTTLYPGAEEGRLDCDCVCSDDGALCRHGAAALFAHSSGWRRDAPLAGAASTAIEERRQRGRTEVKVRKLDGEPWFGTWRARSFSKETHFPRDYTVHVRSLQRRANYCTCPDFATNQLGTCKHIEAVLHQLGKRREFERWRSLPAPMPYVFLDWQVEDAPRIRLHRSGELPADLVASLTRVFDAEGFFRGQVPDDVFLLADQLDGRSDIHLGEDALAHARHVAAAQARAARSSEIRNRVGRTGGHLPGVRARLYPYQSDGVAFLAGNGRALLADDMGLGKTLQAIAAAVWLKTHAGAERTLVLCPASLKQQWAREIERFTDVPVHIVQGPAAERHPQYRRGGGFYIVNYDLVLRDLTEISAGLAPDLVILDEAQRIKNWRTKIATAVKRIPSRYAFVLSGTPLENRLEDLYSLMQVVDPQVLGPLWRYMVDFHITDERGKVLGYRNLSELRRRLAPVMLRRDRRLVRDQLPERIEQRLDVPLTPAQRELHGSALSAAASLAAIAQRRPLTPTEQNRFMAALQQARMACDAAGLVDKHSEGSPKLDELTTLLEELCVQSGLKAVVFSQWEQMTRMVEQRVRDLGLDCVRLHGGVPTAARGALMDRFREDDSVRVFISTDAGGVGLNLQTASVLINLDVPWNPAVLEQRIARVHRLGQKQRVQSILMVAADSYEERVLAMVQGKRALFDNVVDPDATEEVVGVSKKLLEALVEDLTPAQETPEPAAEAVESDMAAMAVEAVNAASAPPVASVAADPLEVELQRTVERIQAAFGAHIERILGAGGGLLVVLDAVTEAAEATASGLSDSVPVALIDPRTLASLERLGAASPIGQTRPVFEPATAPEPRPGARLARQAIERLTAARLLRDQGCIEPALELLVSALLSAAAARGGLDRAPAAAEAVVWVYAQALAQGWLDPQQAALVARAVGLAQAPSVPPTLLTALFDDADGFIGVVADTASDAA